ncbi:dynein axonemal heavy chain 7-like isoform X2 [Harmonia axyridis]|uniref:dynein axonemal heavy chain 7-like isoform X2 n=1 Tax=Harmonia axyridis TaxID=115357 RepID=UPI001E277BEE|nr:dynein axonemal heavy chain 7-like isoform X2 [Harmonia axyridis]
MGDRKTDVKNETDRRRRRHLLLSHCQGSGDANLPILESMMKSYLTDDMMDKFHLGGKKKDYLRHLLSKQAKHEGDRSSKKKIVEMSPTVPEKNISHQLMVKYAQNLPTYGMDRHILENIKRMVGREAVLYPQIVEEMLAETRENFLYVTHKSGVNMKTKPFDESTTRCSQEPYKFMGKTDRYHKFLKNKKRLLQRWSLHLPLIRRILIECRTTLPNVLFEFEAYHSGLHNLDELTSIFNEMADQGYRTLKVFQVKIIDIIEMDKSRLRISETRYYDICSRLLSVYISKVVANTLEHIIEVTGNARRVPFLLLTLRFEGRLVLQPSAEETINVYRDFMNKIVQISRLYETVKKDNYGFFQEQKISIYITTEFFKSCLSRMNKNINTLYEPVLKYTDDLDKQFCEIYEEINTGAVKNEEDMSFERGCSLIEHYREYFEKAQLIRCDEYFSIGELAIYEYLETLRDSILVVEEDLFLQLSSLHQWENEDIIESFQMIETKALQVPTTTEELIEQGKYVVYVKSTLLEELIERIKASLKSLTTLIEYGTLTKEHMDMNSTTVKWLKRIGEVLDRNSEVFEQLKFEAEEFLHKTMDEVKERVKNLMPKLEIFNAMDDFQQARQYMNAMASMMVELRDIDGKISWIRKEESYLGFKPSFYPEYTDMIAFVYPFYHLLKICKDLKRKLLVWLDGQFEFLVFEEAEQILDDFSREYLKQQKFYRSEVRQRQIDKSSFQFEGLVEDIDELKQPSPIKLISQGLQEIKKFRPAMTMMRIMCNPALMDRHWKDMSDIAGFNLTPDAGTSLRKMMKLGLEPNIDQYEVISIGATKERELLNNLTKMQNEWKEIMFKVSSYKDTKLPILTALDDIQVVLDDHIVKALTMRGSVFVKPYEVEVRTFYDKILRINRTIDVLGKVQSQWLYLLPIFSSKDIVSQMPEEGLLFKEVNDTYKRFMDQVVKEPLVFQTAGAAGIYEMMEHCLELLEEINEGVTAYLERKRLYFPRFFFLSNDEMLEILSETKDPLRVQPHLKKCFEAIDKLEFDEALLIHEIISGEGERIRLKNIINPKEAGGSVEKWLVWVEEQMILSVRELILKSNKSYLMMPRNQWVQKWQGQVVLAVSQIQWTTNVHNALNKFEGMDITSFFEDLKEQLQEIVALIRDPTLSMLSRITIKALIVIDVHAKDVVEEMVKHDVQDDKEFKWLSQLRYYIQDDDCVVKLINASVKYAYEYLGNTDRLVITPLTDRCYRTLIGAYHLHLNGAPEGPAGTGKTETTKDLAKALAVQCVVFNCSDGLDYRAMGKFFKGLASCGAWACFDEFNRIDIEVLSVVAQQILSIIMAVRAHLKTFNFEGTELKLNPNCYVCITMNPGYAGRSELPDNLKVLFRTVAMMVPDYAMIGEISLYSFGFIDARNLSVKIVTTYRLCSEQLSSQNHYDYGMRAVKSVLSAAGNNKRSFPNLREPILLLRAIIDVNQPKFLTHDLPLFSGIISDLFPGIKLPKADYTDLTKAIIKCAKSMNLKPVDCFQEKIIQTYEMMIVRHGFMIVGGTFAGKTSTLKVLASSLSLMKSRGHPEESVKYQFLNPKAITMGQLYGQFDPVSYEWFDGVVSNTYRGYTQDISTDRKWIIFDGPVDAVWIENMNSALDDNKKLCLMSGEVMSMTSSMSLIFEVMDLEQASPATVSRCGMIYMEPVALGWGPMFNSWLTTCEAEWLKGRSAMVVQIFNWLVPPSLTFIKKHCVQYCNAGDIALVKNTMKLFEIFMDDAQKGIKKDEEWKSMNIWIEASFIQALLWGIGGILDQQSRAKFDVFLKNILQLEDETNPIPEALEKIEVVLPGDDLMVNYYYHYRQKGLWKHCPDLVRGERVDEATNLQQVLVPTVDTKKYMRLVDKLINYKQQFLLVGPTGTGKSFYIQDHLLNKLNTEKYEPGLITFTVKITANQTQDLIISKVNKKKRGIYGPPAGKTSVIFIDDVNMPEKEMYGAQPPIELLRQFFDHKTWFDLKTTESITLHDMLFTAAMGLVGGSRQDVYARFLRHFIIFSINEFSHETMAKIYQNILLLGWKNNGFPSDVITQVNTTVAASLEIYKSAIENLRPTPSKSHYVFNLRDFSRLILGCAMMRKESITEEVGKKMFPKIWMHEVMRVIYDRLIDTSDKTWLLDKAKQVIKDVFRENFEMVFENLLKEQKGETEQEIFNRLMFGSYFDLDTSEEERKYEECSSIEVFRDLANNFLAEFNNTHKTKMDIVLFDYALEHLSKICRILAMPSGSGLLVGISGSGRQSLTRLASEIYLMKIFQPEITKNYSLNEWRDDIKKVLKESGGMGRNCTLLISEGQIKEETFLLDIDSLLNSGEVPNIYQLDEKQEILDMVRLAAQGGNRNLDVSALTVFFFFTRRCREKLHIILCFSPVGSKFRNRLRLFPALTNCCTIDWFDDWPASALEEVAKNWINEVNLSPDIQESSIRACKHFHVESRKLSDDFFSQFQRKTYITTASYLELIKSFTSLTNTKQEELMKAKNRYLGGLEKLKHASESIAEMQKALGELQPQLAVMSEKATQMTLKIEEETITVEKAASMVRKDERVANRQAAAAQALKKECEADLALAMPILNDALSALDTLKPADITLVKSMKNPPAAVKLVMAAVCIIKDVKPDRKPDPSTGRMTLDYWGPSKKILGDINFLQNLKDFDKDHIKPEIMAKIRKEFIPHKDFKPQIVAKASSAAEGLCKWIIAMDLYDDVIKIVAPKKEKLAKAESEFAHTMGILDEKRNQLKKLEDALAELNEKLDEAVKQQTELQDNVNLCNDKLLRAKKLIGGLGGEKSRWTEAANSLQQKYDGLAGDILLSCGIVAYLSPFDANFRKRAIKNWHAHVRSLQIPCDEDYELAKVLGFEVTIQKWNIFGLPRDAFSIENGIIQDISKRYSLFIDPQSQASTWIKKMEKKNFIEVVKFTYPDYMKKIESCVQNGYPVLIESVEETLEAPLDPLLFKKVFKQAGMDVIALGDNVIAFNNKFRLYMCSKLRNPHYLPEVFNKVTIINFALTLDGLQDQLLGIVVAVEKPELQQLKEELIVQKADNRAALLKVEGDILRTLAETKGDILEDEKAIQVLDESKNLSTEINIKQEKSLVIEKSIEEFRQKYQAVSEHSSVLYYCISDMANVDPMYQYSLDWFINLYISSIQKAENFRLIEKRVQSLINAFTYDLYSNITRSLFEKDKLLFSFLLCCKIMIHHGKLPTQDFMFLLTGGVVIENPHPNPLKWLPNKSWDEMCRAQSMKQFEGVDPMGPLIKFAEEQKFTERFTSISLGQGQGPRAQALIENGTQEGCWVCLQNCHLATSWMPTLEKIFESLDYANTHDYFRLWLTSYPSEKFPVTLLQKGVKMTNEPPTGLQQNLLKSYTTDPVKNPDFFNGCPEKPDMFARLIYGTAFFHAVVQERRSFGALGWNIPYGFNDSDFDISVQQLKMFINESEDPFEALSYLIGECNYGGRVTDDWDRRLIVTILDDFINRRLAESNAYSFNSSSKCYGLPEENTYEAYLNHITQMPQIHLPEVFGLHKNAGITKDLENSNIMLSSVFKASGGISSGGVEDTDKYLRSLISDILQKLPPNFDIEAANKKFPVEYSESMNTVLVQEMERFNKLLNKIRNSLQDMNRAIEGLVAMSPELESFSSSLILAKIPSTWQAVSYPSLKTLPAYIEDFLRRTSFLQKWFTVGKPDLFWISGFFFTQAFLTGVKQNMARKYTIPIDKLTFDFQVMKDQPHSAPEDGSYIFGLHTDGARWDSTGGQLAELFPKVLHDVMPIIWLKPIKMEDLVVGSRYTSPVYKTSNRRGVLSTTGHSTNYVLPILLETRHPISHWIKRSVALLCQLN